MKAHIGADADSGLVHTAIGNAASVGDVTQAHALLHGAKAVTKPAGRPCQTEWITAMRPGLRRALDSALPVDALLDQHRSALRRALATFQPPSTRDTSIENWH